VPTAGRQTAAVRAGLPARSLDTSGRRSVLLWQTQTFPFQRLKQAPAGPTTALRNSNESGSVTKRLHSTQFRPTVSLGVTYVVVCSYGRNDGRISPTHCALIDGRLGGRCSRCQGCRTPPVGARSAHSGLAVALREVSTAAPGGFLRSRTTQR
jgi:hypothetical protein